MKNYIRPEMQCELFMTEDVITTSGTSPSSDPSYVSSLNLLKGEISADSTLKGYAYSEGSWK